MKRGKLLNSQLSYLIARLGHTDTIVLADAGLPIPLGVERIDLAVIRGMPSLRDVLDAVLSEMVVESIVMAEEILLHNGALSATIEQLSGCKATFCSHDAFKERTAKAIAVIRTGEASAYANVILQAGVQF
ncbi:D-ribose pyranase [Entomospira culicis]|uniref:D-ribose pyranase n=1 Tax=Entomospira culicis TaxID=2719989 RepID=A0A968GG24_9SPIO|nr:D-ribose pyranase [Entomospira culicis]NIZ19650.1 D-ribose pyranase [Entomospira culicis]NIZ69864.1 D-ribose pyranase [Entomospira culicis]WDI36970.1 D-ribose pyranase [Entomospira culicis]WDI38599.1 D-ribose pyranase [Entomospira culicis]